MKRTKAATPSRVIGTRTPTKTGELEAGSICVGGGVGHVGHGVGRVGSGVGTCVGHVGRGVGGEGVGIGVGGTGVGGDGVGGAGVGGAGVGGTGVGLGVGTGVGAGVGCTGLFASISSRPGPPLPLVHEPPGSKPLLSFMFTATNLPCSDASTDGAAHTDASKGPVSREVWYCQNDKSLNSVVFHCCKLKL
jgi:hypothetical protein